MTGVAILGGGSFGSALANIAADNGHQVVQWLRDPEMVDLINKSNYVIPQMTRDQKRMAIEGPVAVGGGRIAPRLTKRLLKEIGDNVTVLHNGEILAEGTFDEIEQNEIVRNVYLGRE